MLLALLALGFAPRVALAADTVHIYAAGSLAGALGKLLAESHLPMPDFAAPRFGPSGLLRARIEKGEPADILASADLAQPRLLAQGHGERPVLLFARNRMCAMARPAVGLTEANMLQRLLDPTVRLATSTPGSDPGGDYAWAIFARADTVQPGAGATLRAKAQTLVGGADSKSLVPGHGQVEGVFLADRADVLLGYCSGAPGLIREVPGLVAVPVPPSLAVAPAYGLVLLTDNPLAARFVVFVMSERGQAILAQAGFLPAAATGE
jgi:ABC-type molybdate transport system substrate-binding protein